MTDTETEPSAAPTGDDLIPVMLYTYGLSGEPVRLAPSTWQPVIVSIREANLGRLPVSAVQPLLDLTFPDAGYQAADICLATPPDVDSIQFTADVADNTVTVAEHGGTNLDLPDDNVSWDFGDGTPPLYHAGTPVSHTYAAVGTYTIRHDVTVAGALYSVSGDVEITDVAGPAAPTLIALIPDEAAVGSSSLVLTVVGQGFTDESVLMWNGGDEPSQFVSSTALTTGVRPDTASGPGTIPVTVRNGDLESEPLTFTFTEPVAEPIEATAETEDVFYPADHTVDEVLAWAEANPEYIEELIAEEEAGKNRVTLIDKLNAMLAD